MFLVQPSMFSTQKKIYSGLTRRIRQTFWPNEYDDKSINYKNKNTNFYNYKKRKHRSYYVPSKRKSNCPQPPGLEHGLSVHNQVCVYVRLCILYNDDEEEINTVFYNYFPEPDPCTFRIISFCKLKNWTPICSEYAIWSPRWNIATSVDLIVEDNSDNSMILIELKTGYEGEEYDVCPTDSYMLSPLDMFPNCPLYQHQVQVMAMLIILYKDYDIKMKRCVILRTCPKSKGIMEIELNSLCMKNLEILNQIFCKQKK